jgi:hypothetical protein
MLVALSGVYGRFIHDMMGLVSFSPYCSYAVLRKLSDVPIANRLLMVDKSFHECRGRSIRT